jgi:hypothetical protein
MAVIALEVDAFGFGTARAFFGLASGQQNNHPYKAAAPVIQRNKKRDHIYPHNRFGLVCRF